jgi:hypothetical protein
VVRGRFLARNGDFFITFASEVTNLYARARDRPGTVLSSGTLIDGFACRYRYALFGQKLHDRRGFFPDSRENPANFYARARVVDGRFLATPMSGR